MLIDKLKAMLLSRRFLIAAAGVLATIFNEQLGIPEENTLEIAGIVIAWVLGDAYRETK